MNRHIEAEWLKYVERGLRPDADDRIIIAARRAFYLGCSTMLNRISDAVEDGRDLHQMMLDIEQETTAFLEEVLAGRK